jgi:hypothetical protein
VFAPTGGTIPYPLKYAAIWSPLRFSIALTECKGGRLFWSQINSDPSLKKVKVTTHRGLGGITAVSKWNNVKCHNSSISPALIHELEELEISYFKNEGEEHTRLRSGMIPPLMSRLSC